MSRRQQPAMPASPFGLLLVEGGDEEAGGNARAAEDKGWLRAYLGMLAEPDRRFHQALDHSHGIDPSHAAFAPLRDFVLRLSQP
jgi:hypothetical protein